MIHKKKHCMTKAMGWLSQLITRWLGISPNTLQKTLRMDEGSRGRYRRYANPVRSMKWSGRVTYRISKGGAGSMTHHDIKRQSYSEKLLSSVMIA